LNCHCYSMLLINSLLQQTFFGLPDLVVLWFFSYPSDCSFPSPLAYSALSTLLEFIRVVSAGSSSQATLFRGSYLSHSFSSYHIYVFLSPDLIIWLLNWHPYLDVSRCHKHSIFETQIVILPYTQHLPQIWNTGGLFCTYTLWGFICHNNPSHTTFIKWHLSASVVWDPPSVLAQHNLKP
jgi:hypothetical protein